MEIVPRFWRGSHDQGGGERRLPLGFLEAITMLPFVPRYLSLLAMAVEEAMRYRCYRRSMLIVDEPDLHQYLTTLYYLLYATTIIVTKRQLLANLRRPRPC